METKIQCPCDYNPESSYNIRGIVDIIVGKLIKIMECIFFGNGDMMKKYVQLFIDVFNSGKISTRGHICYVYYLESLKNIPPSMVSTLFLMGQNKYWEQNSSCLSIEDKQHFRAAELSFMFDGWVKI
jgi:hypothetical protein